MLVLFPSKKCKKMPYVARLYADFLNLLETKITTPTGSIYLILFT